jgi:hypothetical protein
MATKERKARKKKGFELLSARIFKVSVFYQPPVSFCALCVRLRPTSVIQE